MAYDRAVAVDLDDAWKWIGYSRKNNAKAALLSAGFIEGADFRISLNDQENSGRGRKSEVIRLTIDCFKSFAMMTGLMPELVALSLRAGCEDPMGLLLLHPLSL